MNQIPNIEEEKEEIIEPDKVFDCFDEGCEECTVCKYLNFREWAEGCAPAGSSIERNQLVEDYLKRKHQQLQKAREKERAFILQELALRDIPEEDGGYPLYTARQISNYLKSEWRIKSDYSELDQDVGITSEENLPEIEITAEFGQVKVITSKEQTNPIQHQPCLHSWDILLTSEPPKHKCSKCGAVRDSITSEDKE